MNRAKAKLLTVMAVLTSMIVVVPGSAAQALGGGSGSVSLTTLGTAYTQNFDTLAAAGTTNPLAINGWYLNETGTSSANNGQYNTGTGSGTGGDVYSFGAALLDLDKPWKVIARGSSYLLSPQTYYECVGDVPNVAFPCASLYDEPTGRIAIYYGGADTVTGLAFTKIDEVLDFVKNNSEL